MMCKDCYAKNIICVEENHVKLMKCNCKGCEEHVNTSCFEKSNHKTGLCEQCLEIYQCKFSKIVDWIK